MTSIHICGNFATEGQCGTCEHFMLWGVSYGACGKRDYEDMYCEDSCEQWGPMKIEEENQC